MKGKTTNRDSHITFAPFSLPLRRQLLNLGFSPEIAQEYQEKRNIINLLWMLGIYDDKKMKKKLQRLVSEIEKLRRTSEERRVSIYDTQNR